MIVAAEQLNLLGAAGLLATLIVVIGVGRLCYILFCYIDNPKNEKNKWYPFWKRVGIVLAILALIAIVIFLIITKNDPPRAGGDDVAPWYG